MRKIILAAALAVGGLAMTTEAKAGVAVVAGPRGVAVGVGPRVGGPGVVGPRVGPGVAHPYYRMHGVRYGGGYYYRGRDHFHWERRVWSPVYGRYHYWDPYLRVYYFYDPIRIGYYPIP
jgi:hypothetical protein